MDEQYVNKVMSTTILILLFVLTFLLLKPILMSIIFGIILAYIFYPVYSFVYRFTHSKNLSATLICSFLILIIVVPSWFLAPIFIEQSLRLYVAAQQTDFITPLKTLFPPLFTSETFSAEVGSVLHSFIIRTIDNFVSSLAGIILELPTFLLQITAALFTFFFVLRDREEMVEYVKSLLPFSKDVEKKLFQYSEGITSSVIYGQIIVGILQGVIAGIGFFIFGVPNALFLTLLASLAGVLPIIGTVVVWVPVVIYLLVDGNSFAGIGVLVIGTFSSTIDNFLRPMIVSRKTSLHSSIILLGMIGGLFMFGVLGLILGPLIIAYLLVILELYRKKKLSGVFIEGPVISPSK